MFLGFVEEPILRLSVCTLMFCAHARLGYERVGFVFVSYVAMMFVLRARAYCKVLRGSRSRSVLYGAVSLVLVNVTRCGVYFRVGAPLDGAGGLTHPCRTGL